jgi:hypothetical protein
MNCSEFRERYEKYTASPLPREVWETEEFSKWNSHLHDCSLCYDWHLLNELKERGVSVDDYPCVHMAYYAAFTCDKHTNLSECAEAAIIYYPQFNEYHIGPRGGRGDDVLIAMCPWCGVKLPESKRDLWLEELDL